MTPDAPKTTTALADVRTVPLGQVPAAVLGRVVPKRTVPPPQVAAFDSAM
jgi:FXSXX-COOH protein